MTHLATQRKQEEIYKSNRKEMLDNLKEKGYRYALILPYEETQIEYFKDKKELYGKYPSLKPNNKPRVCTPPFIVDYERETNSTKYLIEEATLDLRSINKTIKLHKENRKSLIERLRALKN